MLKSPDELIKQAQKNIECVDVVTAKKICDDDSNAVIIDVREAQSAAESKLTDSVNIARGMLEFQLPKAYPDPDTQILTHCAGGGRASLAANTLKQMGYNRVFAITAPYDEIKKVFR